MKKVIFFATFLAFPVFGMEKIKKPSSIRRSSSIECPFKRFDGLTKEQYMHEITKRNQQIFDLVTDMQREEIKQKRLVRGFGQTALSEHRMNAHKLTVYKKEAAIAKLKTENGFLIGFAVSNGLLSPEEIASLPQGSRAQ